MKYISILVIFLLICIPTTSAITIEEYDNYISPISFEIESIDNSSLYESSTLFQQISSSKSFYKNDTDLYFNDFETKFYASKTYSAGAGYLEQNLTVEYPSGYSFTIEFGVSAYATYSTYYIITTNFHTGLNGYTFTDYPINETGNYLITLETDFEDGDGDIRRYYSYYTFSVSSTPIDESYVLPTFTYDANFIGTLGGLICLFVLFAMPMVCAYKIKHTGEKLKWSVYGFIIICIIFFTMIAMFQLGD